MNQSTVFDGGLSYTTTTRVQNCNLHDQAVAMFSQRLSQLSEFGWIAGSPATQLGRGSRTMIRLSPDQDSMDFTATDSISSLNGPAFLSPSRIPMPPISFGFSGALGTSRPNDVATKSESGTLTEIHSSFFV